MNSSRLLFIIALSLMPPVLEGAEMMQPGFEPKQGFVPDEETAIAIAEAVLVPIYGKEQVDGQKPFSVRLTDGVWLIQGTLPAEQLGGVFSIEISKQTAAVLRLTHSR